MVYFLFHPLPPRRKGRLCSEPARSIEQGKARRLSYWVSAISPRTLRQERMTSTVPSTPSTPELMHRS